MIVTNTQKTYLQTSRQLKQPIHICKGAQLLGNQRKEYNLNQSQATLTYIRLAKIKKKANLLEDSIKEHGRT